MSFVVIDAQEAEKARLAAERTRARRDRYEAKHPERKKHHGTNDDHNPYRPKYAEYPFVMWDGEAPQDTGYSLFGSSLGHQICHPRLATEECFDLLLDAAEQNPCTIFVIFGGRYDFDEICRQSMPLDRLSRLKTTGHCTWHGYTIKQAEGKFFEIKKRGRRVEIWESFGWFKKAYVKALTDYQIGTPEELALLDSEKARRANFLWSEIEEINEYMRLELKLGPPLMEKIREICIAAGFNPIAWYGPSALALELLRKNNILNYTGNVPDYVKRASQYAYAGGRFEGVRGGILWPVYTADRNSAYMAAALELPDLAHGHWRAGRHYEPGKFGVYHIRYDRPTDVHIDPTRIHPLFCRHKDGSVNWPNKVEGWYWAPEAELVTDDPYATFLEAYIFDEDNPSVRPFAFVLDMFQKRLHLQALPFDDPIRIAEKAFKWALAAIYGQLARTVGYDRHRNKPPKYHQLEWAGFITSHCRAAMYKLALTVGDKLISIDTDSVTAMCPMTVDEGISLGQWKVEEYDSGVFFQSGVYSYSLDGEWVERKARGMEEDKITKRLPVSPEMMISAMHDGKPIKMKPRSRYISIRMALNNRLDDMGKWTEQAGKLEFGGNGKRYHNPLTCITAPKRGKVQHCPSAEAHVFTPKPAFAYGDSEFGEIVRSQPHLLPWKDDMSDVPDAKLFADLMWIDPDEVEAEDMEWMAQFL